MEHDAIALGPELFRQPVAFGGQLGEPDARPDQAGVGGDVLVGDPVEPLLFPGRLPASADPGARDIDAHAVDADQIGVEGNQVAVADDPRPRLLEPGIGAGAGTQDARFDPLPAPADVLGVQDRPHVVLGRPGAQRLVHLRHRRFAGGDGAAHGLDLVRTLDDPREFGHFLGIGNLDAQLLERAQTGHLDSVDREAAIVPRVLPQHAIDLLGEFPGVLFRAIAAGVRTGDRSCGSPTAPRSHRPRQSRRAPDCG
ncbi:hypothetical protein D3C76_513710 [compost metagenome]